MESPIPVYLLFIGWLVLGFIYLLLVLYSLPCVCKAFSQHLFLPKIFYTFILLACFSLTLFVGFFLYQSGKTLTHPDEEAIRLTDFNSILINTIYVPDAIFWLVYFSLFWQFLIMFHHGHIMSESGNNSWDPGRHMGRIKILFFSYIIIQASFILIQNTLVTTELVTCMILDIIINASIPIGVISSEIYISFKISGSPFFSKNYESQACNEIINPSFFYRQNQKISIFMGTVKDSLADNKYPNSQFLSIYIQDAHLQTDVFEVLNGKQNIPLVWQIFFVFFLIGDFVIVQVIPFLTALNLSFVKVFLTDYTNVLITKNSLQNLVHPEKHQLEQNESYQSNDMISSLQLNLVSIQEIKLNEEIFKSRTNGLGVLKKGTLITQPQTNMIFRVIEFQKMSTYVIDDIKQDLQRFFYLKHSSIATVYGMAHSEKQLILITKLYKNGSLSNLLHGGKQESDNKEDNENQSLYKINLCLSISKSLQYLHNQNIYHGHLSPQNILINDNFTIKITDFGFISLKKYCGIINGYSNINKYSAPECFKEMKKVVQATTPKIDIYSLGMIFYEIHSGSIPFEVLNKQNQFQQDVNLKELQNLVEAQQVRPKIQENIPEEIATLIRCCWQQDPQNRPEIKQIIDILESIKINAE